MADVMVATRLNPVLYAKLLKRREILREITGIELSISDVLRSIVEDSPMPAKPRKARPEAR